MNTAPDFSKLKMSMDFEPLLGINENGDSTLHVAVRLRNVELVWKTLNEPGIDVNHLNFNRKTPLHLACAIGHVSIIWLLVAFGADVFKRDRKNACAYDFEIVQMIVSSDVWQRSLTSIHGDSPLHDAIKYGDWPWEEVKTLIEQQDILVNSTNSYNETPLHLACACGYIDIVELLMSNGADMYKRDCYNNTAIHRAIIKGHVDVVDYFITNYLYDITMKGYQGRSPLHLACCVGNTTLVNDLVLKYHFSEIAVGDASTLTPLHLAVLYNQIAVAEQLITKHGHSVDCVNENKETPLHFACFSGQLPFISMFVHEHQAGLDVCNKDKDRPLNKAVLGGHSNIVRKLISRFDCSSHIKGFEGRSLLHQACIKGNIELSTMLITDFSLDPSSTDDSGNTPLHMACWGGHEELVRLLITKCNCLVDVKNNNKETPLHAACSCGHLSVVGDHEKLVRLLITEFSCPIDVKNNNKETPLHAACSRGHLSVVRMLVSENADMNVCDYEKNTPVSIAVLRGHTEIVQFLISKPKCKLNTRLNEGRTLLHQACYSGRIEVSVMLINDARLDPSSVDDSGNTPLHMACWGGHEKLVRLLITKYKCPVDIQNHELWTPLHFACLFGHRTIVRMLISEYQAEKSVYNNRGDTPLHKAVEGGHTHLLQILIKDFEIYPEIAGFQGRTPLHTACSKDHDSTARSLISSFQLSLLKTDNYGNTPLHISAMHGQSKCVHMLLYDYHAPVLLRNKSGNTALEVSRDSNISNSIKHYLKQERNQLQSEYKELQKISTREYSGAQKLSRVFVVGNVESGKSTLIESLKRESFFLSFSEVSEAIVPPHTCGIVPSVHCSKAWGRVLYYDFAGDPEYYSSHSAILSSVMHSRLGTNLFLIVVNLAKEYNTICEELGYWFSFIANHTNSELTNTCKVLIVGSHADLITHPDANIKVSKLTKEYSTHPIIQVVYTVALNCRRPRSSQPLRRKISQILQVTPAYSLSLNGAILHGLLLKDFKNVITCKLEKVLSHIAETGICLPKTVEPLYLVLHELHTLGLLMIIERNNQVECNSPDITLLLNIPKLTNEVHELLFSDHPASYNVTPQLPTAPYSASMGILPMNYLDDILPDYITVECLVQLQYCQEFNHAVVNSDYSVAPTEACNIPKLFYFPALCKIERKKNIVTPLNYKYKIGWFAKCCGKFDYFPPRFLHVLLLQLAFKFAQPVAPCELSGRSKVEIEMLKSNCRCTMWKNGIHWHMEAGVECIVELVSNNRGLVVITKSDEVHVSKCKCTDMLFKIIDMAMQAKAEYCHSISLKQYLMLLNCDDISSFSNQDKLFDMNDVDRVLKEGKDSVLSITGKWPVKTTTLAHLRKFTFWGKMTTHELVTFT